MKKSTLIVICIIIALYLLSIISYFFVESY